MRQLAEAGIDREARRHRQHPLLHAGLDRGVALVRVRRLQAVENFDDQLADLAEFRGAEAARGRRRRVLCAA